MKQKQYMQLGADEVAFYDVPMGRWEIWPAGDGEQWIDFICKKDNTPYRWWDLPQDFTASDIGCSGKEEGSNELCDFCLLKHGLPDPEAYGWIIKSPLDVVMRFWDKGNMWIDQWEAFNNAIYKDTGNTARWLMVRVLILARVLGLLER